MTPAHASKEWAVSKVTLQSASLLGLHNLPQYKGGSVQLCFPGGKVNMIVEKVGRTHTHTHTHEGDG